MVKPATREDDDLLQTHQTTFNLPWYARVARHVRACERHVAGWKSIGRHSWMS